MTDQPSQSALMQAMNFNAADLYLNQGREISAVQRQRLQRLQWRTVGIGAGIFILLAFVASLCIYLGQSQGQIAFSLMGVLLTILNAIVLGFLARSWLRVSADLRSSKPIEIYEGILERIVRPNGSLNNYVLKVYFHEFSVTKDVFRQFRHAEVYGLYATKHADILLSAECLSQPDA